MLAPLAPLIVCPFCGVRYYARSLNKPFFVGSIS